MVRVYRILRVMPQPAINIAKICFVTNYGKLRNYNFLNQARAGLRPGRAWFLKVEPVRIVSMCVCVCVCFACVCVSAPEAINN